MKKFLRINVLSVEVADPSRPLDDADFKSSKKVGSKLRTSSLSVVPSFLENKSAAENCGLNAGRVRCFCRASVSDADPDWRFTETPYNHDRACCSTKSVSRLGRGRQRRRHRQISGPAPIPPPCRKRALVCRRILLPIARPQSWPDNFR